MMGGGPIVRCAVLRAALRRTGGLDLGAQQAVEHRQRLAARDIQRHEWFDDGGHLVERDRRAQRKKQRIALAK